MEGTLRQREIKTPRVMKSENYSHLCKIYIHVYKFIERKGCLLLRGKIWGIKGRFMF